MHEPETKVSGQPISLIALLATLVLLFGFQGEQIVRQPLIIALLAVPIIIQVYLNAGIAYAINRALDVPHNVALTVGRQSPSFLAPRDLQISGRPDRCNRCYHRDPIEFPPPAGPSCALREWRLRGMSRRPDRQ
jgi:hypothetical protein